MWSEPEIVHSMEQTQKAESLDLKEWMVWKCDWYEYKQKSSYQENWVNVFGHEITVQTYSNVHFFNSVFDCLFFKSILILIESYETYDWNRPENN